MDRGWVRERLTKFIDLVDDYESSKSGVMDDATPRERELRDGLRQQEPTVKRILRRLDPDREPIDLDQLAGAAMARNEAQRGLGILNDLDEVATRLSSDAPVLGADQMHPWVWDAAQTLWESKHYRDAVHAAATSINAHTQNKVGRRDVADDKLIQEIFSEQPAQPGRPRLRVVGEHSDQTVRSRQRGVLQLGLGCFYAIRNPAAHETDEWPEQEALEQLAALSVLARLIDSCEIEH